MVMVIPPLLLSSPGCHHCCGHPLVVIIFMVSSSSLFPILLLLSFYHPHCSPSFSSSPSTTLIVPLSILLLVIIPTLSLFGGWLCHSNTDKKPVINKQDKLAEMKIKETYLGKLCASKMACLQPGSSLVVGRGGHCHIHDMSHHRWSVVPSLSLLFPHPSPLLLLLSSFFPHLSFTVFSSALLLLFGGWSCHSNTL